MRATGEVFDLFRRDLPGADTGKKNGIQLADLVDIVRLAPVFRALLNGPGREAWGKSVRRDLLAPEPMQRDPEIAQLQGAAGPNKHVPRRDVAMDGSARMNHRHGTEEMNNLAAR